MSFAVSEEIGQNIANAITGGRLISKVKSDNLNSSEKHYTSECKFITVYLVGVAEPAEYFVKKVPVNSSRISKILKGHDIFGKEAKFFTVFVDDVDHFCGLKFSETGTKEYDKVKEFFPKVVYASNSCLYSENLRKSRFVPSKCKDGQDFHHTKIVLKKLAKFHARTFAMIKDMGERKFSQTYDFREVHFLQNETDFCNEYEDSLVSFITPVMDSILTLLKNNNGAQQQKYYKRLAHYESNSFNRICQILMLPTKFQVVNHGDLWNNNMFFSYDEKDLPKDVKFFDMQVTRINSPAVDISYYFNSLEINMRKRCWKNLLQLYFEEFASEIKNMGLNFELPFQDLVEDFRCKSVVGFIFGLCGIVFWSPILTYVSNSHCNDNKENCSQTLFTDVALAAAKWVQDNEQEASILLMDKIIEYIEECEQMGVQF